MSESDAVPSAQRSAEPGGVSSPWNGWGGDLIAALAVLLGAVLLFGFAPGFGGGPGGGGGRPPHLQPAGHDLSNAILLISSAALMFLRRRWPLLVFALVLAGLGLGVGFGVPTIGPSIALAIAAHTLASAASRRTTFLVVGGAALVLLVLSAWLGGWESLDVRLVQAAAAVAVAAALGDSARSRRAYLRAVTERAERAEQTREAEALRRVSEERLRIARDLHDTVAHQISVISLNAGVASGALTERPERAQEALGTIRGAARAALADIGHLLRFLRAAEDGGVEPPQPGLSDIEDLIARMHAAGLDIAAGARSELHLVGDRVGRVAYRIVQEGLTNALKHGTGRRATVDLAVHDEQLQIVISNAVAPDTAPFRVGTGLGLIGIRERVAAVGGRVTCGAHGAVYRLVAELPLATPDETSAR
ncbi:sensor histidine kinase [Leucobacter luti]|uniref:sensor histidine kinase n=1 Tax=Leucobacter luti TaxID=340320 RepID=UPI001C691B84|nr:histidine kinase [Leucobacter luti]QYM76102.1 sensor histidine kinase [Leucobacter luti]